MEVEQKRRGPKKKHGPREEFHLKFSPEVVQYIQSRSPKGVQAYFDELIKRDMEQGKEKD